MDEADPVLVSALGNHVLWMVDTGTEEGRDHALSYGVSGIPAYVLLTAGEEIVDRWSGFGGSDAWAERFAEATADPVPVAERKARFDESPSVEDALFLARVTGESERYAEGIAYCDRALELDPVAAREENVLHLRFSFAFFGLLDGELPAEEAGRILESALADPETEEKTVMTFARLVSYGVRRVGLEPMEPLFRAARPRVEAYEGEEYAGAKHAFLLEYAVKIDKDPERGLAMKRESLPGGWETDAEQLNDFAWWCFENAVNLEEAEALARKGAELAESDPVRGNILDTVAEIVNLRGDPSEAVRLMERAAELDTSNVYFREQLDRFRAIRDGNTGES